MSRDPHPYRTRTRRSTSLLPYRPPAPGILVVEVQRCPSPSCVPPHEVLTRLSCSEASPSASAQSWRSAGHRNQSRSRSLLLLQPRAVASRSWTVADRSTNLRAGDLWNGQGGWTSRYVILHPPSVPHETSTQLYLRTLLETRDIRTEDPESHTYQMSTSSGLPPTYTHGHPPSLAPSSHWYSCSPPV